MKLSPYDVSQLSGLCCGAYQGRISMFHEMKVVSRDLASLLFMAQTGTPKLYSTQEHVHWYQIFYAVVDIYPSRLCSTYRFV